MVEVASASEDCHAGNSQPAKVEYNSYDVSPMQLLQPTADDLRSNWRNAYGWFLANVLAARHLSVANIGIANGLLCLLSIAVCNVSADWLVWSCLLTQQLGRLVLPWLFLCCSCLWISWVIHRFDVSNSVAWIISLFVTEELVLRCLSVNHSFSVNLLLVLLLGGGATVSVYLDYIDDRVTLLGLTGAALYRLAYCHLLSAILLSESSYSSTLACLSAVAGVALSKVWSEPSLSSEEHEFRCSKITVIRRGNSSLDSAMANHSSYTAPIRRTSLPALGLPARRASLSSMDLTTLGEVHGMISDIMVDSSLTPNVAGTLRIVADMISPLLRNTFQRNSFSSPLVTVLEKTASQMLENQDSVQDQPDIKDDTPLSFKHRLQQQLGLRSRRMSNSYTTTTTASGMPSMDHHRRHNAQEAAATSTGPVPKGTQRAKSYAGMRSQSGEQRRETFKSFSFSQHSSPLIKSDAFERPKTCQTILVEDPGASEEETENKTVGLPRVSLDSTPLFSLMEDEATPPNSPPCSPIRKSQPTNLAVSETPPTRKTSRDETAARSHCNFDTTDGRPDAESGIIQVDVEAEKTMAENEDVVNTLSGILDWEFPLFELDEKCNVLTQLALHIFGMSGLFASFNIDVDVFIRYFRCLESGYHNIPYHNRIHASDVLHGVHYLTKHPIAGFKGESETSSRRSSCSNEIEQGTQVGKECSELIQRTDYGCLADVIPDLELMALYTAAAMHDYDHPGRTNAFLVATLNSKALLYNDRSVLENHHAAASWSMLVSDPNLNFLSDLDPTDFKRFRFIVIEEILSTDLKRHFDFLTEWSGKISGCGSEIDWQNESDRLLVGQMCIKLADISGPSKSWDLHCRWTERIVEEFYLQGDDEKHHGMPVSPYMDRSQSKVPQLQESFIKHLVGPLYDAYMRADIMPGKWSDSLEPEMEANRKEESADEESSDLCSVCHFGRRDNPGTDVVVHSMIDNINSNHQQWIKLIVEEKERETAIESNQGRTECDGHNGNICNGTTSK